MKARVTIDDIQIRQDAEGRYSLNGLHRAAGEEDRHQPSNFLRLDTTQALMEEINSSDVRNLKDGISSIQTKQKLGTYVCKELVYAYAMWISPPID